MAVGKSISLPRKDLIDLFSHTMGLEGLDQKSVEELAGMALAYQFPQGDFIFYEGDTADHVHIVASGRVKVAKISSNGRYFTVNVACRGETINAVVVFNKSPQFLSAQAMDDVVVACIKAGEFVSFIYRHPAMAINCINILRQIVESSYERIVDLIEAQVEQRLLNALHMLHNKFGSVLRFTNNELADLAGTTTESSIRVVNRLKKQGLIQTHYGQVSILDSNKLKTLSRGPLLI